MKDTNIIIDCLEKSPGILRDFIREIPAELHKVNRIHGKWNIHQHTCHLADVQPMLIKRFELFRDNPEPVIEPFLPGKSVPEDNLMGMDMTQSVKDFGKYRQELISLVGTFQEETWQRKARHPEYKEYTPYILLRHILMHDHLHMYRIEELWITNDEYLRK